MPWHQNYMVVSLLKYKLPGVFICKHVLDKIKIQPPYT